MMKIKILLAIILLTTGILVIKSLPDGKTHIIMCNVGQGDGLLIRTPGGKNYVIDTGPDNSILNCIAQKISPFYVHINGILITHPHADHIGGASEIINRYGTDILLLNSIKYDSPEVKHLYEEVKQNKQNIREISKGEYINLDKNISAYVFYPDNTSWNRKTGEWKSYLNDLNDSSIVFSILYEQTMVIFTGDAGCDVLDKIPDSTEYTEQIKRAKKRVLKIPHHGSLTGNCSRFVQSYKPQIALLSVGKENQFNLPNIQTISKYNNMKTQILRTDLQGTVSLEINRDNVKVKTARQ